MKQLLFLLFVLGLNLPGMANAKYPDTTKYGWSISQEETSCNAITVFEDDSVLSFWVDWRDDTVVVYFTNDSWTSLQKRDGQEVRFDFELLGEVEYDKWYSDKAEIVGKENFFGFRLWWEKQDKVDLLTNWSVANAFRATADARNLGQFTLRGSKAAMLELVRCAADGLKYDRSDPFAT